MKRAARWAAAASVVGVLLAWAPRIGAASPAKAAENDKRAALLRTGADALKAKNWPACIDAFAAAAAIDEGPDARGPQGVCEEAAGHNADAFRHLSAVLDAPGVDRKVEPYKRFAEVLGRVTARVAQVFLAVDPPGAAVIVDGRPLGKAEGRVVILNPGQHTFAARLDGYQDAVEPRKLEPGDAPSVHLVLVAKPKAATLPPVLPLGAPPPIDLPWYRPGGTARGVFVTLAYVGAATALVSWGTEIGLELDRASLQKGLSRDACSAVTLGPSGDYVDSPSRPPQCAALQQRAHQRDTAMDVAIGASIGTGVAALAAGVALGVEGRPSHPAVVPTIGAHGGGIVVMGAW